MTGVPRPNLYDTGRPIPLLLGFDADEDVFAAWDATKHQHTRDPRARGGSNSLYVPHATLVDARRHGFSSHDRVLADGTPEVVVAFRPETADHYFRLATALRASGARNVSATAQAARGGPVKAAGLSQHRIQVLRQVRQTVRSARFPGEVLTAYDSKCAFCGLGAKLIEAAHIKSVGSHGPDHVTNGMALCPTHHKAFDRFLIIIKDDYSVALNPRWMQLMTAADRMKLKASLETRVLLPQDPGLWPDLRFVRAHRAAATA